MNNEKKKALMLIKTAKGQLEGIINMIEEERYCIDISHQIMASQGLLKKASKLILKQHLDHCVLNAAMSHDEIEIKKKTEEITEILDRLLEGR